MIEYLSIDLETKSGTDLSKSGVYRYTEDPEFEILLFGYSVNGGEASVIDMACGEQIPEDVLRATEYVVPCLELVDVRQRLDVPRKVFDSIADNASFGAFVVGDTPVRPYAIDFGLVGYVYEHNNRQAEVSCGAAVLDHPVKAVAWLANRFREIGQPLRAGEFILSGSAIAMETAAAGDNFRCRYGRLGEVSVNFV